MDESERRKDKSTAEIEAYLDDLKWEFWKAMKQPKFILETFGFVVLIVYATFTILIWCANKKAAQAARDAANMAQSELDASKASQRAILMADAAWDEKKGVITYTLKNIGHSAAVGVTLSGSDHTGTPAPRGSLNTAMHGAFPPDEELQNRIRPLCHAGGNIIIRDGDPTGWSSDDYVNIGPEVKSGSLYYYRYMSFAYSDVFGVERYGYVCMRYNHVRQWFEKCGVPDFDKQKCN